MKRLKKLMVSFLGICIMITSIGVVEVQAATPRYIRAYKNVLQKCIKDNPFDVASGNNLEFCLLDIDKNGTKELIVHDPEAWMDATIIYTYYNNRIRELGRTDGAIACLRVDSSRKVIIMDIYPDSIYVLDSIVYKINKGKLKQVVSTSYVAADWNYNGSPAVYMINDKKTTKSKYNKICEKYKTDDLKMHPLNISSIKKYCK